MSKQEQQQKICFSKRVTYISTPRKQNHGLLFSTTLLNYEKMAHIPPWYDDPNISRTQIGHFALSDCEPCLQTGVTIYRSRRQDPWI